MTKIQSFAATLTESLPPNLQLIDTNKKEIHILCNNVLDHDYIDDQIKGPWIIKYNNRLEIWRDKYFVGRCDKTSEAAIEFIQKQCTKMGDKNIEKNINQELCDYLTSEFNKHNIEIIIKAPLPDYARYLVKTPKNKEYVIKATYKDEIVTIAKNNPNVSQLIPFTRFNLGCPDVHEIICKTILNLEDVDEYQRH